MSFNIIKQLNADEQEGSSGNTGETAAKTNVPEQTMETVITETPNVVEIEIKAPAGPAPNTV